MKISLNRIILFGRDVSRLKKFYQEHFKFKMTEEIDDEWMVLAAGQTEIAFHRIGDEYDTNKDKPFKAGNNIKLVFEVSSDLHALREELLERGVLLGKIRSFADSQSLFCDGEDPEGNVFQLWQKLT